MPDSDACGSDGGYLGLGLIILGLIVLFGFSFTTVKLVLVVAFLWTTGPVSSHLIAQMMDRKKEKERRGGKREMTIFLIF